MSRDDLEPCDDPACIRWDIVSDPVHGGPHHAGVCTADGRRLVPETARRGYDYGSAVRLLPKCRCVAVEMVGGTAFCADCGAPWGLVL